MPPAYMRSLGGSADQKTLPLLHLLPRLTNCTMPPIYVLPKQHFAVPLTILVVESSKTCSPLVSYVYISPGVTSVE